MKITIECGGYTFSKDWGFAPETLKDDEPADIMPDVHIVLDAACYLVSRVYGDRVSKDTIKEVGEKY